jgi:hypothetical protein
MRRTRNAALVAGLVGGLLLTVGAAAAGAADPPSAPVPPGQLSAAVPLPGLAALNVGRYATLADLTCPSAGNCAAAGTYDDRAGLAQDWVASEVRGTWRPARRIPGAVTLSKGGPASVDFLSCPAAGDCTVIGEANNAAEGPLTFAATSANGTWSGARPLPKDLQTMMFEAMSCPRQGACVLGGETTANDSPAAVVYQRGTTWGAPQVLPGVAALSPDFTSVDQLACQRPGDCTVSGGYGEVPVAGGLNTELYVASEVNGRWHRATALPGIVKRNAGGLATDQVISCPSVGNCAIGGTYQLNTQFDVPFVANEVKGVWRAAKPLSASTDLAGAVTSLSCAAALTCSATVYDQVDFIVREKNGAWGGPLTFPNPSARQSASVAAISCRAAADCVALGGVWQQEGFTAGEVDQFVANEVNGAWARLTQFTAVRGGGTAGSATLACAPGGNCVIAGDDYDASGTDIYVMTYRPA